MITISQFVLAQAGMCSESPLKGAAIVAEYGLMLVVLLVFIFIPVAIIFTLFKITVTLFETIVPHFEKFSIKEFKNFSIKKFFNQKIFKVGAPITGVLSGVGVWLNNEDVLLNGNVSIDSLMRYLNPIVALNAILTSFYHIKDMIGC